MYCRDPDGDQVELQVDDFDSTEALQAWFRSGAFAANPIGVNYDADALLEKSRAGVSVAELVQQGSV